MNSVTTKIFPVLTVLAIYTLTFIIVYMFYPFLDFEYNMLNVFIADAAATTIVFLFSFVFNNSSIYDPYWSVAPPFIVIYLMKLNPDGNLIRQYIILALVLFWSIRLTLNWVRGWKGLKHQDWRYISIAEKTGKFYWPVSFLGIHMMPTIFVFLGCLPLWYSLSASTPFNIADVFALAFTFCAVLTEWIADEQLIRLKRDGSVGRYIQSGLWAYSRHPNYLGEISFWIGIYLFLLSSSGLKNADGYWTAVGFIAMILLFTLISIPMMEKRNLAKKPGYDVYISQVPALIPRLIKKRKI